MALIPPDAIAQSRLLHRHRDFQGVAFFHREFVNAVSPILRSAVTRAGGCSSAALAKPAPYAVSVRASRRRRFAAGRAWSFHFDLQTYGEGLGSLGLASCGCPCFS